MWKKYTLDNYLDLLKLILPEFLINHFDLIKNTKNGEVMHLYFEERNVVPKEEKSKMFDVYCYLPVPLLG